MGQGVYEDVSTGCFSFQALYYLAASSVPQENTLRDLPLLSVYFQVNNGVLYYLDYIEDIYIIRALSVLVSTFDLKIVFTTSNKLYYTTIRTSLFPSQSLNQNHTRYVISTTDVGLALL